MNLCQTFRCALMSTLIVSLSSCAAMFTGKSDDVHFVLNPPDPDATLVVDGESFPLQTVELSKKTESVVVMTRDASYRVPIKRTMQAGFVIMDILFTPGYGLVGVLVDGGTGAWYKLPSEIVVDVASMRARTPGDAEGLEIVACDAPSIRSEELEASESEVAEATERLERSRYTGP